MSIATEITEDDYRIAASFAEYWMPGEYGPLPCGCCLVACEFDPRGPALCMVMARKDAAEHEHAPADFASLRP